METLAAQFRERFWSAPPPLPPGVRLERLDSFAVAQRGPSGTSVFDLVELRRREQRVRFLAAYRPRVLAGEAITSKKRLRAVIDELRLRDARGAPPHPMIITGQIGPKAIDVCQREGLAVIDGRGTLLVDTEGLLIHVLGSGPAVEAHPQRRVNIFRGRGARVVRLLLAAPAAVPNIRALSRAAELSYARTHDVVQVLAREGFIERLAGHGGVRLRDPVGLLRAWVSSEDPSAASVERFNLRSTTDHTLRAGFERLEARGVRAVFSLASAVPEDARWVTALPHGLYTTATRGVLEEAFELRTHPPHNFLVLRPDPPADTDKGGVYTAARSLAAGPAVFIPQLIVDLHRHGGGRGGEQADRLLEQWSSALPLSSVTDEAAQ